MATTFPQPGADHRDRLARRLSGQKRVLEMIALGDPMEDVLNAITSLIETEEPGVLCSILRLNREEQTVHPIAGASVPQSYIY